MAPRAVDYYQYDASLAAGILFAVLYTAAFLVTVYQYVALKCWFWIFMVIASTMEAIGYIGRIVSIEQRTQLGPYIVQFLMIFLAPAVIAASCYMAMGRIVLHVTPMSYRTIKCLWITPRWMTPLFVACDVIAFLIQVFGGVQSTSDDVNAKITAYKIMKIGLGVQLVCFGLFLVISFRFHVVSKRFIQYWPDAKWRKFLWVLNISCSLIFIRSVYRMVEFSSSFNGYLATHEWNFYFFEAVMILPVFILFSVFHPANYVSNIGWRQKRIDEEISSRPESQLEMNRRTSDVMYTTPNK